MIKKDIDDNAGEAPSLRSQEHLRLQENRVGVGEGINFAMEHDAIDEVPGIGLQKGFTRPADEITQQSAGSGSVAGVGEMEVGEEVQGLRA